jgi:integrase
MKIWKPKDSNFWHFQFEYRGRRYHRSTGLKNRREAESFANAYRTNLVKQEVGLVPREPAPTLQHFRKSFLENVRAEKHDKPRTVKFYTYCFDALLGYGPLAGARLDQIDDKLVSRFTLWAQAKPGIEVSTVNRWRATLRKALYLAQKWKLIVTVPAISRLKGERERKFVFTPEIREKYDELAPEPLNSIVQLSCENGICVGEALHLLKPEVHMTEEADDWGHYGYLVIRQGKSEYRKRNLFITARAKQILKSWMAKSCCQLVFTREDGLTPISPYTLDLQQKRMRKKLNLPWDAVVHSARHTALTNFGLGQADPFSVQKIAGHAALSTTLKYVHATSESMKRAFQQKAHYERGLGKKKVLTMPSKRPRGRGSK